MSGAGGRWREVGRMIWRSGEISVAAHLMSNPRPSLEAEHLLGDRRPCHLHGLLPEAHPSQQGAKREGKASGHAGPQTQVCGTTF